MSSSPLWRNPLGTVLLYGVAARPFRAGAGLALPPAHARHAGARMGAARARPADPAAHRRACRRHAPAPRLVRHPRTPTSMWCGRCGSPRRHRRRQADRAGRDLGTWLPRPLFLAALSPLVSERRAVAVDRRRAGPGAGPARLCPCRPDDRGDGPAVADAIDPALFDDAIATKDRIDRRIYFGFVAIVAAVLAARLVRDQIERRNLIEVGYADGQRCACRKATACWRPAGSAASRIMRSAAAAAAARPAASGDRGSRRTARSPASDRGGDAAPHPRRGRTSGSPAS